jgi:hypothetical protein
VNDGNYARFIAECCAALGVSVADVLGRSREAGPEMHARHLLSYLLRERHGLSFPRIARVMHRLDHTTSMHSVQKIRVLLAARDRLTVAALERVTGVGQPMLGLEAPLDSLRYCGADNGAVFELATEAVG